MAASIALERDGKALVCKSRERKKPSSLRIGGGFLWSRNGMNHAWYVTYEVPTDGTLLRRRHPRLTQTFETEAAARDFARKKFNDGLIVTAGTINPHLPRVSIPSVEIPAWLEPRSQVDPDQ